MDGGVREIEKERLLAMAANEFHCFFGIASSHPVLSISIEQIHDLFISQQRDHRLASGCGGLVHVVRIGNAEVMVEPVARRQKRWLIPEVPFADAHRGVTLILQKFRNGMFLGVDSMTTCGKEDTRDRNSHAIAARHDLSSRNRTDRSRIETGQFHPFTGHAVQIRSAVFCGAIGADVPIAQIVDENQHDVRP